MRFDIRNFPDSFDLERLSATLDLIKKLPKDDPRRHFESLVIKPSQQNNVFKGMIEFEGYPLVVEREKG